jgi:uncharacterized protein (TIGR02118 family)
MRAAGSTSPIAAARIFPCAALVEPGAKGVAVEERIAGQAPRSPAPYLAMGHLLFQSVEELHKAFDLHAQTIMSDIPKYTNTQPIIQISEV